VPRPQRARLTSAQHAPFDHFQHCTRQVEESDRVAHVRAALADTRGDLVVAHPEAAREPLEAVRLVDGVQILAHQVFDQRHLERCMVVEFAHHYRHDAEARDPRRAPAPLAGHQLVAGGSAVGRRSQPDHQRFDNSLAADRLRQLLEPSGIEMAARLERTRHDLIKLDAQDPAAVDARSRRR
jgi:hypothetical protein